MVASSDGSGVLAAAGRRTSTERYFSYSGKFAMEIFSKLAMAFLEGNGDFKILNSCKFKLISVKGEFENGMKMTLIFTIIFISKMLIKQISHN